MARSYRQEVIADAPVLYWRLDEASGATAEDQSGNARDGTYTGSPTLAVPGLITNGTAARFDGSTQYVERADEAAFDFTGTAAFTMEGWFTPSLIDTGFRRLMGHASASDVDGYTLLLHASQGLRFLRCVTSANTVVGPLLVAGRRYYIVTTYDGANMRLYVGDTVSKQLAMYGPTADARTLVAVSVPYTVGRHSAGGDNFRGDIDEAALYSTALSPDRVAAHFVAGHRVDEYYRRPPWSSAQAVSTTGYDLLRFFAKKPLKVVELSGTLSFSGDVAKQTGRLLEGALSFVGALNTARLVLLQATLSFAGTATKQTDRALSGVLSFAGVMTKRLPALLTATLSFAGNLSKGVRKTLPATLFFPDRYPSLLDSTATAFSTSTTSHLVNMPPVVQPGDLLLLSIMWGTASMPSPPAGWTTKLNDNDGARNYAILARIADGSEGGTTVDVVSFNAQQALALVCRLKNTWNTVDANGIVIARTGFASNTTTPDAPSSGVAAWGTAATLWLTGLFWSTNPTVITTAPTGYGKLQQCNGPRSIICSTRQSEASSENPSAWVVSSGQGVAWVMGIRPAAANPAIDTLVKQVSRLLDASLWFGPRGISLTETSFGSAATAHLVQMPAQVNRDDILLAFFANSATATVTTPAGWVLLDTVGQIGVRASAFYKLADGTEGGTTVDFVTSVAKQAAAQVYRLTNSSELNHSGWSTGVSTAPNAPAAVTGWGPGQNLYITAFAQNDDGAVSSYPTNYGFGVATVSAAGSASTVVGIGSARRLLDEDTEDAGAFTIPSANWAAITVVVRPKLGGYRDAVKAEGGLLNYWRMNDRSGTAMVAEVGGVDGIYGNTPSLGVMSHTGDGDRAVTFNGIDEFATITRDLSAFNQLTIEFILTWVAYANDDDMAMEYTAATHLNAGAFYIDPNGSGAGGGKVNVSMSNAGAVFNDALFNRPSAGVPHHYIVELDRTAPAAAVMGENVPIAVWVDGVRQVITKANVTQMTGNFANSVLYVMCRGGTTLFGNGTLDELAIHSGLLAKERIAAHYSAITPNILAKRTGKALTGTLSFAGSVVGEIVVTAIQVLLTATLSFSGAISRRTGKALPATLSFVGTLRRDITRTLRATLSFHTFDPDIFDPDIFGADPGRLFKQTRRTIAATLSFSGATALLRAKLFTATLSFAGAVTKSTSRTLTGTLSFVGTLTKRTNRTLTAALSFVGSVSKSISRTLTATLAFVGVFATSKTFLRTLTATLSFVGTVTKQTGKALPATLSFIGTLNRQTSRTLTATLSFVGAVTKRTSRTLTGTLSFVGTRTAATTFTRTMTATLSFVGAVTKRTSRTLTGTLSFIGTITKRDVFKSLTATLSFIGSTTKRTSRTLTATLQFVGVFITSKTFLRTFTGTLTFAGAVTKQTGKALPATLSFIGTLNRRTSRTLTATLSFVGATFKQTRRTLTATLQFVGVFATSKTFLRTLTATLSFVGASTKQTGKALAGTLSFAGTLPRQTRALRTAVLSFAGSLTKQTRRTLAATLLFSGTTAAAHAFVRTLTATLSFAGVVTKRTSRTLNGTLSFSAAVTKRTAKALTGVLSFSGTALRRFPHHLNATLSFGGSLTKQTRRTLVAAVLSFSGFFTGARNNEFFKTFTATLSFSGSLQPSIAKRIVKALAEYFTMLRGTTSVTRTRTLTGTGEATTLLTGTTAAGSVMHGETEYTTLLHGETEYSVD